MIISEVKFGLGNQLFQYAAGRSLSYFHCVPLLLQAGHFKMNNERDYALKYFEIPKFETNNEINSREEYFYYKEPHHHYDKHFFSVPSNIYISGNWQSEKYFKNIEGILRKELKIKKEYIYHLNLKRDEIHSTNSVCLHIRRGDYLHNDFLNVLPISYYIKAIEILSKNIKYLKIYIFSDDIDWAKKNLNIIHDHEFVTGNTIEDFYLMQHCKYHIIANSSFSWWTAWLCEFREKIIIAPEKWFNDILINTKNLTPNQWKKI